MPTDLDDALVKDLGPATEGGWQEVGETAVGEQGPPGGRSASEGGAPTRRHSPVITVNWDEVRSMLGAAETGGDTGEGIAQFNVAELEGLWESCLRDEEFVAGVPNECKEAWRAYFHWDRGGQELTREQKVVLTWLEEGVKVDWVPVEHPAQREHPRFGKRLQLVKELIEKTFPNQPAKAQELLCGNKPGSVQFPNRVSAEQHAGFVQDAIDDMVRTGAVEAVSQRDVQVVSGLGVVANAAGKKRLILDARYINLYDKYASFSYEQLSDIPQYAQPGDYLSLTDFKSGYHHFLVHPEDRKYLGLYFNGQYYRFRVLPFGLASACRTYTRFMQQVYQPLRAKGWEMTFLIDDACYVFRNKNLGLRRMVVLVKLLTVLGFCMSRGKCQIEPCKREKFLGLIVDLEKQAFAVPEAKARAIMEEWRRVRKGGYTKRGVAKVAGMLISVAPAVRLAPLYTRRLYQAMGKASDWDDELPEEAETLADEDYAFWEETLGREASKPWRESRIVYSCAGDASAKGYGGFSDDLLQAPMVESFTVEEQQLMEAGQLSSCHREVRNMCLLVRTCLQNNAEKLRGAELVVYCDNMGAVSNFNSMNGKPATLAEIRQTLELTWSHDLLVRAQWLSRETDLIRKADELSRVEDPGEFALARDLYQRVCRHRSEGVGAWGFPTGDCFAGTSPEFHQVGRYLTRYPAPGGLGADGLFCPWSLLDPPAPATPLLWVFPPRHLAKAAMAKIAEERRNAILLVPNMPKKWRVRLTHLPVVDELQLRPQKGMFVIGSRFPEKLKAAGPYEAWVSCFLIRYGPHRAERKPREKKRGRAGV